MTKKVNQKIVDINNEASLSSNKIAAASGVIGTGVTLIADAMAPTGFTAVTTALGITSAPWIVTAAPVITTGAAIVGIGAIVWDILKN